jgi:ComF family protein
LVCRFKFNRNLACGAALSDELLLMVEEQCKALPGLIVPVPLHRTRQFQRNFNQADILARTVGKGIDVQVSSLFLKRRQRTRAQSGLDAKARRKNTRGAFSLGKASKRLGVRHIALVDDVMTTGATLAECSRVLKHAGVQTVSAWVAARAPIA